MGCGSSKVDDLPAVGVCRERCSFLDEAIHQRYALAAAHMAYINSLNSIGHSLHLFIQQHTHKDFSSSSPSLSSPSPSPPHHKNRIVKHVSPSPSPFHSSNSNSGSHLRFHSDSEEEEEDGGILHHHSGHSSPYHNDFSESDHHLSFPSPSPYNNRMQMNLMQKKPTSSIVYEQRPMNAETVYVGEASSSSSSFNPYPYPYHQYPPSSSSSYPFYGSSSPYRPPPAPASSSKPPPSPPRSSPWDFLNFFNSDDNYYSQTQTQTQYTPSSRESKEVREEEGIPDLEDEDYQQEVVKEVHGDHKLRVDAGGNDKNSKAAAAVEDEEVEYQVHVVDHDDHHTSTSKAKEPPPPAAAAFRNPFEVAKQIELHFQRASHSASLISNMLELGKLPYNRKHSPYQG